MLFNSFEFIFLFLPVTLLTSFCLNKLGYHRYIIVFLTAASLFFYAWWNPPYLGLLLLSILFNYGFGRILNHQSARPKLKTLFLILGIGSNLALIGYFKYTDFFISTSNTVLNTDFNLKNIILPLGISFFTFQQIAYLVDAYRGETKEHNFLNYSLFISFFPQLIAGPIVHHKELLPQFLARTNWFNLTDLTVGITIFFFGLFKKVVFADSVAVYANPVFDAAAQGTAPALFESWIAAIAYTLQLYFDFSGYSDMAIGIALMFGIRLPLNFNSPYQSIDIIDFWRRWHITLSNFLRDYLYIPLGGNRKGKFRRNLNLMTTMLLGGLWHGAGWTFVFWGGLHGFYLIVNNQWRSFRQSLGHNLSLGHNQSASRWWSIAFSRLVTFLLVVIGWVFFRAEGMNAAFEILQGMIGLNGFSYTSSVLETIDPFLQKWMLPFIVFLLLVIWFAPNTQQYMEGYQPVLPYEKAKPTLPSPSTLNSSLNSSFFNKLRWKPNQTWALISGIITALALLNLERVSEFLYFNF